jgi:N-acetylneuraminic acid mutarotase
MDPATISNSSVYLRDSFNSIVAVGVTYSDRIATINPVTLQPLTVYTGVVTADAKDLHGYSLPFEYTWTFTSVDLDRMSPEVQVTNPSDGATDVPWNIRLGVGFSENIDPASISSSTVYVRDAAFNVVSADIHISSGKDLLITPQSLLAPIKAYTGIVTTGVRDLAGNPITTEYSWSFTTADVERIPPEVTATIPENGATCVPVETEIRVSTSEQLLSDSVNDTTFYVKDALSNPVDATIRDVWDRATLAPTSPLAASTSYTATMSTGVTDLNGNPFATNQTLTFTTDGPGTGSWGDISMVNAPALRKRHTAIWTGAEMIVWGGFNESVPGGYLGDGARYDPLSDIWTPVSDVGAPSSRQGHTAVWTDSEISIWGGGDASGKGDGARYDPATDTWKSISNVGAPTPKTNHTAVWTGSEMIIWGYRSGTTEPEGARYDPATDTWTPLSMVGAPRQILFHSAVWTGTEMIIWGGGEIDGARYDPANDTWTQMSTVNGPSLRRGHVAAWTGSEMLVWGGVWLAAGSLGSGARYDTITDTWHPMNSVCAPLPRAWAAGVWTGSDFVLWGGLEYWGGEALQFRGGGRYDPLTNTWRSTPLDNAPTGGLDPTAVWTGSEVIVWGPSGGGRYRP